MTPPRRSKRHLNMLASVAVCGGLMIAYYLAVGQGRIPDDTHIVMEHYDCADAGCAAWQVDILADGGTVYQGRAVAGLRGIYRYKLSKFAVRRILRVFDRARFFELKSNGYAMAAGRARCRLTLSSAQQKMSIPYSCDETAAEIAKPVAAVELASHAAQLASKGEARGAGLKPVAGSLGAGDVVRSLGAARIP